MAQSYLWVRIINNVGLETNQPIGTLISVSMKEASEMIRKGFVEIHVNNIGRNAPCDIEDDDDDLDFFFGDDDNK